MKKIIFIQGPQGSGKTTTARALVELACKDFFTEKLQASRKEIDNRPVDCVQSHNTVVSYIECNAIGELITLTQHSQPHKVNVHIIEAFTLYPEELSYIKHACAAGVQYVFTSQLPPPEELKDFIVLLKTEKL